jgi:hypothetical protein
MGTSTGTGADAGTPSRKAAPLTGREATTLPESGTSPHRPTPTEPAACATNLTEAASRLHPASALAAELARLILMS